MVPLAATGCPPPEGPLMRYLVLGFYIAAAAWTALDSGDSPWAVVHVSGVIAGVCALGLALTYAGRIGVLDRQLHGEQEPDQAQIEMDRWDEEEW